MKTPLLLALLIFTFGCTHAQPKTPAQVAENWLKCPPPNPRRPALCEKSCCGDGSNWHMSCITFVGETTNAAYGSVDAELLKGYAKNPPHEYGNPMLAWKAMEDTGRARIDLENIEPGSAVFFAIPAFPRGHVAIYTGEKDADGVPLVVTTGGYKNKILRKEPVTKTATDAKGTILGWAKL